MEAQGGPAGRGPRWTDRIRSEWRAWLTSRTGGGIVIGIVIVALVATTLSNGVPQPSPTTGPSGGPTPIPDPTATPTVTQPPEAAWGKLSLPAWEPVAQLRPVDTDASGVAVASAFVLRSLTDQPAIDVAHRITAEPAVAFDVRAGASPDEAQLVPTAPLEQGILYRFRLADPTGALAGSWAYRTEQPLHVVGSVPGDQTTGVPIDTGIEIEFDQDGVTDISGHFAIEPATAGRFEVHGRTIVFVPTQPLAAATVYRITISAGVAMTGSDQVLEAPVTIAFETASPSGGTPWDIGLGRPILEASPGEAPLVALDLWFDERTTKAPTSIPVEVYRLPSFEAARAAATTLAVVPSWYDWSAGGTVATDGLAKVASFDATFESQSPDGYRVVRFPAVLPSGWYLVVVPRDGRDRQALLQVTDLTAYVLTSDTRTLAWANDRATGDPVAGAELLAPDGASIGSTAANGLLDIPTPAALMARPGAYGMGATTIATLVAPDGHRLLVPLGLGSRTSAYQYERSDSSQAAEPRNRWWLLLSTDRTQYRSTDTIHAWGSIRSRDDGSVPTGLVVTLRTSEDSSVDGPWLARVPVTATSRGTWATDLPIADLPLGGYVVEVHADDTVASSTWLEVAEIRKPAYQIEVTTDRSAAIEGDTVAISARAVFFDGTPAAGLELKVDAFGQSRTLTADSDGWIRLTQPAHGEGPGIGYGYITVAPVRPEEGEISGSADVIVIPASVWLKGSGTVRDGRAVIEGTISATDVDLVESVRATGGWPDDPSGDSIAGASVTIGVVEVIPVRKQVGTSYDYIEKVAVPLYEYTETRNSVGTYTTTSGAGGAITLSAPVPTADHTYEVTLTSRDAKGRVALTTIYATAPDVGLEASGPIPPYLQAWTCGYYSEQHSVGDTLNLTMHDGDGTPSTGGRYLFVVASRGIRDAVLQDSSTLTRTFAASDLPSLSVLVVRFQAGTYVVSNEILVQLRPEDRALGVEMTTDQPRYQPGGKATVTIRTTDGDGRPVAADVVVRGVDEKLFAMGGALDIDALDGLLSSTGDGLLQSFASHPLPLPNLYGCGDTGGGGRDDFRDTVVFKLVTTGADGTATLTFPLPDDLTSWHLTATALTADLRAGSGTLLVPVGLPFFADAVIASGFLGGEQPVLRVRSFGDRLTTTDRVRYTISAPSLLLPPTTVDAAGFATATLQLPPLPLGTHDVTIQATVIGDAGRTDTLVRKLVVHASRLEIATSQLTTAAGAAAVGGSGLTTYVVTDAGRGSLVPILQDLAYGGGARLDRLLAADVARDLLTGTFGFDDASLPPIDLDLTRYERNGLALLPYSSADLPLTAMAAIVAPDRLDRAAIRAALRQWIQGDSVTRERAIIATAGLAGLGDDVLADLRAVDVSSITVREALWVALGLVAAGDEDGARTIERQLLTDQGQELGPWVRLDVGGSLADTLDAAALLALVATGIGDPLAPRIDRYLREMQTSEAIYVLPKLGIVSWSLDRLPRASAQFAWTVDNARHVETLAPGASWSVALTEGQRAGFRLETLAGAIAVVASWTAVPTAGDLPSGGLVTIARTVTPADDAPTTGLVKVSLRIVFGAKAPTGCWEVTDRAPSGLAPVAAVPGWSDDEAVPRSGYAPVDVSGQKIAWCIDPAIRRSWELTYAARVVSAGTFTWEPAVIQSVTAPGVGATTPASSYTIR